MKKEANAKVEVIGKVRKSIIIFCCMLVSILNAQNLVDRLTEVNKGYVDIGAYETTEKGELEVNVAYNGSSTELTSGEAAPLENNFLISMNMAAPNPTANLTGLPTEKVETDFSVSAALAAPADAENFNITANSVDFTVKAASENNNEVPVYLILGQSNAGGWAIDGASTTTAITDLSYTSGLAATNAFIWNNSVSTDDKWVQHWYTHSSDAKTGQNQDTSVNGGSSSARDIGAPLVYLHRTKFSDSEIYLIKWAVSGTSIADIPSTHWNIMQTGSSITDSLWYRFKNSTFPNAITQLVAKGKKPVIKGIFWMQGETNDNGTAWDGVGTDSENKTMTVEQYQSHLEKLVERLKTELVVGEVNYFTEDTKIMIGSISKKLAAYVGNVRKAQEIVVKADPQVYLINNDNAQMRSDNIHFCPDDYFDMATQILEITEPISSELTKGYVKADALGTGTSWENASGLISTLINNPLITEIYVAAGTYTEDFTISKGKTVFGGYSEDGTKREKDLQGFPWEFTNNTIINGSVIITGTADGLTINKSGFTIANLNSANLLGTLKDCKTSGTAWRIGANNVKILGTMITGVDVGTANDSGWGGCLQKRLVDGDLTTTIENSWLTGGTAAIGSAIMYAAGTCNMRNCIVSHNKNTNGALTLPNSAGAVIVWDNAVLNMVNCSVLRNESAEDNKGTYGGVGGTGTVNLTNCIVWGGTSPEGTTASISATNVTTVTYTATDDGATYSGVGNVKLTSNPFISSTESGIINAGTGDWKLNSESILINAGDNAAVTADAKDFAGNPRIWNPETQIDPENQTVGVVDIGAYEYQAIAKRKVVYANFEAIDVNNPIKTPVTVTDGDIAPVRLPIPSWIVEYFASSDTGLATPIAEDEMTAGSYTVKAKDETGNWIAANAEIFVISSVPEQTVKILKDSNETTLGRFYPGVPVSGTITPSVSTKYIVKWSITEGSEVFSSSYSFTMPGEDVTITVTEADITTNRFVTVTGAGDKNGYSWEHAFSGNSIQTALNDAAVTKVCILGGTYPLSTTLDISSAKTIEGSYEIIEGVATRLKVETSAHGDGSIIYPWEFRNPTILKPSTEMTTRLISASAPRIVLDGITCRDAMTTGIGASDGGVILLKNANSTLEVKNSRFINNNLVGCGDYYGGAVFGDNPSTGTTVLLKL